MTNERKNVTQPADWWAVWQAEADKHNGGNLSEFVGERVNATLPKQIAKNLSQRPAAHRPKKELPNE
jgi:hypothetical protein